MRFRSRWWVLSALALFGSAKGAKAQQDPLAFTSHGTLVINSEPLNINTDELTISLNHKQIQLKRSELIRFVLAVFLSCFLSLQYAAAQTGTWTANANGNWSDTTKWLSSTVANGSGNTANFTNNITADRTVTLDSDRTIGNINFSDNGSSGSAWVVNPSTSQILTLSGGSTISTLTNASLGMRIDGTAGFTKTGAGTLFLSGNNANTITGTINLSSGTLSMSKSSDAAWAFPGNQININGGTLLRGTSAAQLGTGSAITLNSGTWDLGSFDQDIATLNFQGGTMQNVAAYVAPGSTNGLRITGTRFDGFTTSNALTLGNVTMNNSVKLMSLATNITFDATNNGTATINGDIITQTSSRIFGFLVNDGTAAIDMEVNGTLLSSGGPISVLKSNAGTLRLSGSVSNASGSYQVQGGTLILNKTAGISAVNGDLTISGGSVKLGANFQTPNTSNLVINSGTYDTGGFRNDFASLSDTGGNINLNGGTLVANNSSNMTFAGNMSGAGDFTYAGSGTLSLSGNNTQTANTFINGGTFKVISDTGLSPNATYFMNNAAGATLDVGVASPHINGLSSSQALSQLIGNGGIIFINVPSNMTFAGSISGALQMLLTGNSTVYTLSGNNTSTFTINIFTGLTLQAGSTTAFSPNASFVLTASDSVLDLNNFNNTIGGLSSNISTAQIKLGTATLTDNQSGNQTYSGSISGTGGKLTKSGTGTLTLNGSIASTYTGATTVNSGTLVVNTTITGSSFTVNNTATLSGTGTLGPVNIANGGNLSPATIGTTGAITVSTLTMTAGAILNIDISSTSNFDSVIVGSGSTVVLNNATLSGTRIGGFVAPFGSSYTIISNASGGSEIGTFNGLPEGAFFLFNNQVFAIHYNVGTYSINNGVFTTLTPGGNVVIAAIPEPTTWALIALSTAAAAWYGYRRYKQSSLNWEAVIVGPEDQLA